ncbi:hypothetical protein BH23ACT2_BH23ACT2_17580 [soil metagenome]
MSDLISCPNCGATVPPAAAFCTSCGHRMGEEEPAGTGPSDADDATLVDTPGLHDDTAVFRPPAAPPSSPPSGAPWQPTETAPPAAPPWDRPAAPPPPPGWQTPPGQPGQAGPHWGAPLQGPPQWGTAPAPPARSSKRPSPLGGIVAILGAIMVMVGVFTPWIGNNQDDTLFEASGWDLASGDKGLESTDPYLLVALAIAAVAIGVVLIIGLLRPVARIAAVVVGLVVIAVMVRDWMTIADTVADRGSDFEITAQLGFYLTIAGGVVTALASLLPATKAR